LEEIGMMKKQYTPGEETFWQKLVVPEEDRAAFTSAEWRGGYRWFKSENIVCLEHYRVETKPAPQQKAS
jgi:hypothetical protein